MLKKLVLTIFALFVSQHILAKPAPVRAQSLSAQMWMLRNISIGGTDAIRGSDIAPRFDAIEFLANGNLRLAGAAEIAKGKWRLSGKTLTLTLTKTSNTSPKPRAGVTVLTFTTAEIDTKESDVHPGKMLKQLTLQGKNGGKKIKYTFLEFEGKGG
jgi:hypothetical protein